MEEYVPCVQGPVEAFHLFSFGFSLILIWAE